MHQKLATGRPSSWNSWEKFHAIAGGFPCVPDCTHCCEGILSVSIPELRNIESVMGVLPGWQKGCPFRHSGGCLVYAVRPFMCRLFGFRFIHPELQAQAFCPKKPLFRPGDQEARLFLDYLKYCETVGYVLLGGSPDSPGFPRYVRENRRMLRRFPYLAAFADLLVGGREILGSELPSA